MFSYLPCELFATEKGRYVFDAKKVVFLEVDQPTFDILEILREKRRTLGELVASLPQHSAQEIRATRDEIRELQKRGYLKPSRFVRDRSFDRVEFERVLSKAMTGFTVYITTQCNLACSYCIYGGDYIRYPQFVRANMSWKTAEAMVDFLSERSPESRTVRLDYFGGEPLLAFDLIKKSLAYLKSRVGPRGTEVQATIASNGTIMAREILDFLRAEGIYLQFSIDGDREVHDRRRRFRSTGRGSFDRVLRNLEFVHQHAPDYFEKFIRVKCVITLDTLDRSDDPTFGHPLLRVLNDKGFLSLVIQEPHYDPGLDSAYFREIQRVGEKLLAGRGLKTLDGLLGRLTSRERSFFEMTFGLFYDVQAVNKLYFGTSRKIPFAKGCLMGSGDGAVDPDGDIRICHKATSFVIGNVNEGKWDFDRIWELYSRLYDGGSECASCFVQKFCELCFEKLDGGDWDHSRRQFCDFTRRQYTLCFSVFLQVLERNPRLWRDLDRIVGLRMKQKIEDLKSSAEKAVGKTRGRTR